MRKMMMSIAVAAIALAPSLGLAHSPNPNGSCNNVEAEPADVAAADLYVVSATPAVWQETNKKAGLQTHAHTCTDGDTGREITIPADTRLV